MTHDTTTDTTTDSPDLAAAYERLATALTAPAGADRLVAERVAVRRRRRHATQGLAAAVAVVTAIGAATLVGGGAAESRPLAPAPVASASDPTDAPTDAPDNGRTDGRTDATPDDPCGLTSEEASRLVRERQARDGRLAISLAELSRALGPC